MKIVSDNLPCLAGQIQIIDILNIPQDTQEYLESNLMSRSLPLHAQLTVQCQHSQQVLCSFGE